MKFTEHGYRKHDEKHQKYYCMTMGDLKIDLMQYMMKKKKTELKVRLVDVKEEVLMADWNNGWEIELLDVHTVHMNAENEDIIVACFRDDETEWE